MSREWFYAHDEKIYGPISLEALGNFVTQVPEPHNLRIWKAGFPDWTMAGAVKEVAVLIRTPPPPAERKTWWEI